MKLRVAAAAVFVCSVAIAAGTATPEAHAFSEPPPYQSLRSGGTLSSFFNGFKNILLGTGSEGTAYGTLVGSETPQTAAGASSWAYRARVGARLLPRFGMVATRVSLVATAGYIGWRVYQHYKGGDKTYDMWLNSPSFGGDALYNFMNVPFGTQQARLHWGTGGYPVPGWTTPPLSDVPYCQATFGTDSCFEAQLSVYGSGSSTSRAPWAQWTPGGLPADQQFTEWADWDKCFAYYGAADMPICYGYPYSLGGMDPLWESQLGYGVWKTMQNLEGRTFFGGAQAKIVRLPGRIRGVDVAFPAVPEVEPAGVVLMIPRDGLVGTVGQAGTIAGTPDVSTNYTAPDDAAETETDVQAALDAFDTPCGRALINHLLKPAFYPWVPGCVEAAPAAEPEAQTVTLLRPLVNETYTDYVARLQADGWLGTVTDVELSVDDPSVGPEAIQRISITGQSGAWYRSVWPTTWPRIAIDAPLTIYHNSATAPIAPADPADDEPPDGGGVFDSGGCDPWLTASPDFSPLTSLNFGSKFPFGLFSWVGGILGGLSVTPDAPNWDFHIVIPATSVSSETDLGHFVVDLTYFDDYMSTVRLILTFVLWVGAVWFFATALLGLRAPGNPAEAVDEA